MKHLLFAFLYFCEGAPIGLVWWALPSELLSLGLSVEVITPITASLALPWALKFFWGPIIDRIQFSFLSFPRWVGILQVGMVLALLPIATSDSVDINLLWFSLLMHAIFASGQDVAADAWAIHKSDESERGSLNAYMQVGMISGRWLFGAGLLIASDFISFENATIVLSIFLLVSALCLIFHPGLQKWGKLTEKVAAKDRLPFWQPLKQKNVILGFLCALTAGLGFEAFGGVVSPFLDSVGYTKVDIGWFYTMSLIAMGIGAVIGGKLADKLGHRVVFTLSLIVIFTLILFYLSITYFTTDLALLSFAFGITMYLSIGLMISSSYAFFMDISDKTQNKATSFSLIMSGTNACEACASFSIGRIVPVFGYPFLSLLMGLASLLALPILRRKD